MFKLFLINLKTLVIPPKKRILWKSIKSKFNRIFQIPIIGLQWSTKIQPKSFFENHLTSWPGFDPRDGKFFFLLFYLIWLSLSSESSQFKNFAKTLKTLWENNIFNKKHVIILKLLNILANFLNWDDSELKLSQIK
jgi:hypothetical protein